MKKLNLALAALAALSLASCSSDEPAPVANNGDGVTFTVQLPGDMAQSRAFSDGLSALNLTAAAYDAQGNFVTSNTGTFDGTTLTTTISLDLVNGYDYDVVFWAQNSAANQAYTLNTATGKLAVDYSKVTPNSDNFDCFYTVVKNLGIKANMPAQNVTLNRPMAQINVGTSDLSKESVKKAFMTNGTWNLNTSIKASVYTGMNLLTGAVEGTAAAYTFENIPLIAANTETFPVSGYEYMAMVYVLQSPTKLTEQGVVTFNNGTTKVSEIEIPNLPLQRNYRTNIYGQLLTSTTNFTVTIDPIYETPDLAPSFKVATAADFSAALNSPFGAVNIELAANANITMPDLAGKKQVNITGAKVDNGDGTFSYPSQLTVEEGTNVEGVNIYIKDLILHTPANASGNRQTPFNGDTDGVDNNLTLSIENCVADGAGLLMGVEKNVIIKNTHWTMPAGPHADQSFFQMASDNLLIEDCVFDTPVGAALIIHPYTLSTVYVATVKNTTFNTVATNPNKSAAVKIYDAVAPVKLILDNCTNNGFDAIWGWYDSYGARKATTTVMIDGTQVFPAL